MKKKIELLADHEDFEVNLTLHAVPVSIIQEFTEEIVVPYYNGNLNAAIQDLMSKALSEQEFIHSRITHIKKPSKR